MANWIGSCRSNWFRVKDVQALKESLDDWPILVHERDEKDGEDPRVCLLSDDDSGGWPSAILGPDDEELEFDVSTLICPHLADGEVLVLQEVGAERLRYLTGVAVAYNQRGDFVRINLDDIYEKAAAVFCVPVESINHCQY